MKRMIFTIGLLSFLIMSITAKADLRTEPKPEVWVMSVEMCRVLPDEIQDAIKRGIIHQPQLIKMKQCRWFGIGTSDIGQNNELETWPSNQDCIDHPVFAPEGFVIRNRNCQKID